MRIDEPIEWILPGLPQQTMDEAVMARKAAQAEAYKVKLQNEFDEFRSIRKYVLDNMSFLRGKKILMEVGSIQFLPTHECVIINDLLLVSFTEAKYMIEDLKEIEKKAKEAAENQENKR